MMAPVIFYRVQSDTSRAKHVVGKGISAEDMKTKLGFNSKDKLRRKLRQKVLDHLDWNCQNPSIYISAYANKHTAMWEARRRIKAKHFNVLIFEIDVSKTWEETCKRVEYRNIRKLATTLKIKIGDRARNNSKHEYIFLHHVPEDAIIEISGQRDIWQHFEGREG
jgi:hypothetical protein